MNIEDKINLISKDRTLLTYKELALKFIKNGFKGLGKLYCDMYKDTTVDAGAVSATRLLSNPKFKQAMRECLLEGCGDLKEMATPELFLKHVIAVLEDPKSTKRERLLANEQLGKYLQLFKEHASQSVVNVYQKYSGELNRLQSNRIATLDKVT